MSIVYIQQRHTFIITLHYLDVLLKPAPDVDDKMEPITMNMPQ